MNVVRHYRGRRHYQHSAQRYYCLKQALFRIARRTSGSHIRSQSVRNVGVIVLWLIVDERTASANDPWVEDIRCMLPQGECFALIYQF